MFHSEITDILLKSKLRNAAAYWLTRTGGRVIYAVRPDYIEQAEAEMDEGILQGHSPAWLKERLDNWARLVKRWCDEIDHRRDIAEGHIWEG